MVTQWRCFGAERGSVSREDDEFASLVRQIESGAGELNLSPYVIHLAVEFAAFEHELSLQDRIALIMLITASMAALQEGSTRFPVTGPSAREPLERILGPLCGDAFGPAGARSMCERIEALLTSGGAAHVVGTRLEECKPLLYSPPFISQQRVRMAEARLAARLSARLNAGGAAAGEEQGSAALEDVLARPSLREARALTLSEEQRAAVTKGAMRQLTVISGGPGTGKTSIVLSILRVLVRLGIEPGEIALAAPTGKAAFRMGDSVRSGLSQIRAPAPADEALAAVCPEPSTVHRLLGYSPRRGLFLHHHNNPLSAAVIIVDEGSMLDLVLMERLLGALRREARLIVLGDADQLPSVSAGAVFRDLVPEAGASAEAAGPRARVATRLTYNYRVEQSDQAGRSVLSLAGAINAGQLDAFDTGRAPLSLRRVRPGELHFAGVELVAEDANRAEFLDRWYEARVAEQEFDALSRRVYAQTGDGFGGDDAALLSRLFEHRAASRILCLTRTLFTGADYINAGLHRRAAQSLGLPPGWAAFLPGEPVMVVRNDYERMLFNGDQGVIVRMRRAAAREALMAVFARGSGFIAFRLAALAESLELCYASTVHKAQGSEFDCVALVMPGHDIPILTREILYTGVTRSRNSVVVVGSGEILRQGIARRIERYSGLADELVFARQKRANQ